MTIVTTSADKSAIVTSCSRRRVSLFSDRPFVAKLKSQNLSPAVGDRVLFTEEKGEYLVETVLPRNNVISRSYEGKEKILGVNIDRLFCITAPPPLLNLGYIDRVLTTCYAARIPVSLVFNKLDLDAALIEAPFNLYRQLGYSVLRSSTKQEGGLDELRQALFHDQLNTVMFAGMSGVGKSSLLNKFVPDAKQKTGAVSEKTGQGKQTTSQSFAYPLQRSGRSPLFIIDLPGVQNFGVTHLSLDIVADSFPEIRDNRHLCQFGDCAHIKEENCGIKEALRSGTMDQERYNSYCMMLHEIESSKPY